MQLVSHLQLCSFLKYDCSKVQPNLRTPYIIQVLCLSMLTNEMNFELHVNEFVFAINSSMSKLHSLHCSSKFWIFFNCLKPESNQPNIVVPPCNFPWFKVFPHSISMILRQFLVLNCPHLRFSSVQCPNPRSPQVYRNRPITFWQRTLWCPLQLPSQ
jgi:hypothetical protein